MRIVLTIILLTVFGSLYSQSPLPPPGIMIDQLGYYPDAPKCAVVTGIPVRDVFYVVAVGSNLPSWQTGLDTVFFGRLGPLATSANSSVQTRLADFSGLSRPGIYRIMVPGYANSYPFTIAARVFHPLAVATLKGYYYQRSAMALDARYAGIWARPAGHPDTAVLVHSSAAGPVRTAGTVISATGGWYDAGDYNKYVVNSGITMGTLLDAYEDFPAYLDSLHTNIPPVPGAGGAARRVAGAGGDGDGTASADGAGAAGIPGILNEAIYNLRWMLLMQDPADGGVYHKCTNAAFDGMVMPGVTTTPRYVVQKGTAATLDFAAVTAQAARILRKYGAELPGLADSCKLAAIKAWQWAQRYPDSIYDQTELDKTFAPPITTGAYGDRHFDDERFWAAAELLITTDDGQYLPTLRARIADTVALPSWASVAMLGNYSLLRHAAVVPASLKPALDTVRQGLLRLADRYVQQAGGGAFHTVMGESKQDFVWGSNAVAANEGMLLLNAWLQQHKQGYLDAALTNLDYLLGRNATGYCFITGLGSHSPLHPHHRMSIADGIVPPVPGLLAGGPNPGRQDHQTYVYTDPETAYIDQDQAYASNEIAINWNAPLVYLAVGFEALQYTVGYAQVGQTAPAGQPAPPAQALQPMLHPPTTDRSGIYHSNFPIGGVLSEQFSLHADGTFEYSHLSGNALDSAHGTYEISREKVYLTFASGRSQQTLVVGPSLRNYAGRPRLLYLHGKKLYRADERGRIVKMAPGASGKRMYLLVGSRKRTYYLVQETN